MSLGETEILAAIDSLRTRISCICSTAARADGEYNNMMPNVFELDSGGRCGGRIADCFAGRRPSANCAGDRTGCMSFWLDEVQQTLDELSRRNEPLVLKLERQPGQKEARYAHLLSGEIDQAAIAVESATPRSSGSSSNERIEKLEDEVESLHSELEQFKQDFAEFRKQFE